MDMIEAIENSCNVYFYNLIQEIGLERWVRYGQMFKIGTLTGIDIPEEKAGNLPDQKYLDKKYGKNGWTIGLLLNMVIGQGDLVITPIDMSRYICALATRGKIITPHVGRAVFNKNDETLKLLSFPSDSITNINHRTWELIENGMRQVVAGENGTAKVTDIKGLKIHGKTGTAQNPHGEAHGWFIGYSANPLFPYAIVVFIENGKSGSSSAAPMAKNIMNFYWKASSF